MIERVPQNALIITTDAAAARTALEAFAARGVRGALVDNAPAAAARLQELPWDLVLCDHVGEESFALLQQVRHDYPELPIVMFSAAACVQTAARAVRSGCQDFLPKPLDLGALQGVLSAILPNHEVPMAAADEEDSRCLYRIAGRSPQFLEAIRLATRVAPTSVPVLITGESGTGKELVSYLLHRHSQRVRGPYIRVNCAALSESLLESELFGHERGAFTGAYQRRKGRFERAHGGTLLLDEISETTPRLQAELLRVLEQQDFERVGGTEAVRVNVRIISTSNRDLAAETQQGRFRKDLFYRLSGVHLQVPPLRQRPEDVPVLVWHFVNLYAAEVRRAIVRLDEEMLDLFCHYAWPGNVRELRNFVRSAMILGEGPVLSLAGLGAVRAQLQAGRIEGQYVAASAATGDKRPTNLTQSTLTLQDLERQAVLEALRRTQRNQTKAAQLLGITDRTLREKLRRYRQDGQLEPAGETTW